MQLLKWISFLALGLVAAAESANPDSKTPPTELQIDTTYLPDECPVKAAKGDSIKVHYTGTLFSNGNKFDSRSVGRASSGSCRYLRWLLAC